MSNLARKIHMKVDTYNEACCSCLILPFPAWSFLPLAFFSFLAPMPKCSKKNMCPRVRERENNERAPKLNWQKVTNWSSKAFLWMRPLFSSFSIIFLRFPPHMQLVTFHLIFLLISIIFINKCAKMPHKALAIAFANFLSHKQPNEHPLGCLAQRLAWNKCPSHPWLLFLTFITWNFHQGCYRTLPLGGHRPRCSITHIPQQHAERIHTTYGYL